MIISGVEVPSTIVYIGIGVLLVLIFSISILAKGKLAYRKVELFTPAEKNFLRALDRAIGSRYRVFGKCRIADVVLPQKSLSKKKWNRHFWSVSSKHFDYVIADKTTLEVLCVIELNDSSHNKTDRAQRDVMIEEVCKSANLHLLWVKAQKRYDITALSEQITDSIC